MSRASLRRKDELSRMCVGNLRAGDHVALENVVHDASGVFKGVYVGSLPARMPAAPSERPEFVAGLLRSMHALQTPTKVRVIVVSLSRVHVYVYGRTL